mmetsp:Transcript_11145/g.12267  ORF Transcript_11145/g.12267 Transcript_11145/m.12267 type:complete len:327 (-) Transcript_11145:9-989(-)
MEPEKRETNANEGFSILPPEIALCIVDFASTPTALLNTMLTSKFLCNVCKGSLLYKTIATTHSVIHGVGGEELSAICGNIRGLAFDNDGNLIVIDNKLHLIHKIDIKTNKTTTFESTRDKLEFPQDVVVDKNNNIFFCNSGTCRILYLEANTNTLKVLIYSHNWARGISIMPSGDICYSLRKENRFCVVRNPTLSNNGGRLYDEDIKEIIEAKRPVGLAFDGKGNLYYRANQWQTLLIYCLNLETKVETLLFKRKCIYKWGYIFYKNGSLLFCWGGSILRLFVDTGDIVHIRMNHNKTEDITSIAYHEDMLYFSHQEKVSKIKIPI